MYGLHSINNLFGYKRVKQGYLMDCANKLVHIFDNTQQARDKYSSSKGNFDADVLKYALRLKGYEVTDYGRAATAALLNPVIKLRGDASPRLVGYIVMSTSDDKHYIALRSEKDYWCLLDSVPNDDLDGPMHMSKCYLRSQKGDLINFLATRTYRLLKVSHHPPDTLSRVTVNTARTNSLRECRRR